MGTLTAKVPRLDSHCPHKLPTSCRLTATSTCCACQDKRSQNPTYSVYVDGIGFVQRGTRWQGYCWYCQEFWKNRVAASGLEPRQTQIPDRPDQTVFIRKWFIFHQGHLTIKTSSGGEETIAIPTRNINWAETSPGTLPKLASAFEREFSARYGPEVLLSLQETRPTPSLESIDSGNTTDPLQSIDDFFDNLEMEEEASQEMELPHRPRSQRPNTPQRLTSTSGSSLSMPGRNLLHTRPTPQPSNTRHRSSEQSTPTNSQRNPRQIQSARQSRHRERLQQVFGTAEDIQSENYVSPVGDMFSRAWGRYRQVETDRQIAEQLSPRENTQPYRSPLSELDPSSIQPRNVQPTLMDSERHAAALLTSAATSAIDTSQYAQRAWLERQFVPTQVTSEELVLRDLQRYDDWSLHNDPFLINVDESERQTIENMSALARLHVYSRAAFRTRLSLIEPDTDPNAAPNENVRGPTQLREMIESMSWREFNLFLWDISSDILNDLLVYHATSNIPLEHQNHRPRRRTPTPIFLAAVSRSIDIARRSVNRYDALDTGNSDTSRGSPLVRMPGHAHLVNSERAALIHFGNPSTDPTPIQPPSSRGLDNDDSRPPPLTDEQMMVEMKCAVCYSQKPSVLLLPCGHMIMCEWCADIQVPTKDAQSLQHIPQRRDARCPKCRKGVKGVHRVYYG